MISQKIRSVIAFIVNNFGPLLVFYSINHLYGLKPAIFGSLLFSIGEISYRAYHKQKTTAIFKYSAAMSLIFGLFDLYAEQSVLFKYEAAVTNFLTAGVFAVSLFAERSMIQDFYEKQPNARPVTAAKLIYFRWLTMVWVAYFLLKVGAYIWLAQEYSLEQGLLIRTVVGSATFYALLALSIFGSPKIFPLLQRYQLLPQDK